MFGHKKRSFLALCARYGRIPPPEIKSIKTAQIQPDTDEISAEEVYALEGGKQPPGDSIADTLTSPRQHGRVSSSSREKVLVAPTGETGEGKNRPTNLHREDLKIGQREEEGARDVMSRKHEIEPVQKQRERLGAVARSPVVKHSERGDEAKTKDVAHRRKETVRGKGGVDARLSTKDHIVNDHDDTNLKRDRLIRSESDSDVNRLSGTRKEEVEGADEHVGGNRRDAHVTTTKQAGV